MKQSVDGTDCVKRDAVSSKHMRGNMGHLVAQKSTTVSHFRWKKTFKKVHFYINYQKLFKNEKK